MKSRKQAGFACVAIDVVKFAAEGAPPPGEFRIFRKGWNGAEADPDRVLFDDAAAAAVLAAQEKHGVDRMIDLEHRSLDKESASYDGDARGWCRLEVRDGELWAVDVRWTEDGASRLTKKTQRYVSPAFSYDKKTKRVESIFNIALTALPATHDADELVAANARIPRDLRRFSTGVSLNELSLALGAALRDLYPETEDTMMCGPYVCDVFDASVVYEYDGKLFEAPYTVAGSSVKLGAAVEVRRTYSPITATPAPAPASQTARFAAGGKMDPKLITEALDALIAGDTEKCAELLKNLVASAAGGEAAPPEGEEAPPAANEASPPPGDEPDPAMAAASARLITLTAKPSLVQALEAVETWRESHMKLAAEQEVVAKQKAVLEADERDALTVELAKILGPGVAWANPLEATDRSKRKPAAVFASLPLVELREHVARVKATPARTPTPGPASNSHGLTADQLRYAAEYGANAEDVAALKQQLGR